MAKQETTGSDNLDLAVRRKRVGLHQRDIAKALGLRRKAAISEFELRGWPLPRGLTRDDYEQVLEEAERRGAPMGPA